jgi:nucleoside-diphosphate-sugar epimerase
MEFPRPSWSDLADANIFLPLRLLEACGQCPRAPHVILISTGLAYRDQGRPLRENDPLGTVHPYGASKAAADLVIQSMAVERGIPLTVLRPFSFTGPGDVGSRLFPSLLRAAQSKTPLQLTSGRQVRDFLSARDVAAGIIAVAQKSPPPVRQVAVYNLGSGYARPVRRIVQEVVRELGLKVVLRFGKKKAAEGEPGFLVADARKARRELGWVPRENFAHALWRLARASFPRLALPEPAEKARIR